MKAKLCRILNIEEINIPITTTCSSEYYDYILVKENE